MMKRLLTSIVLLVSINCICQMPPNKEMDNIIGTWQAETNEVSSAYHDTYTFYTNNKFEFKPTGYNGLNRMLIIAGTYRKELDKIIFHVNSTTELVGGQIERSTITTLSDSWAIDGGKLVTKKIKSEEQTASFGLCKSDENQHNCIQIDGRVFYKINKEE